ncbi:MAG TPA: FtsX-like permease family protein [Mycobacteriales bacterium]|nr:FtsX-like permease family protein [Mycobacteriales bacterium]
MSGATTLLRALLHRVGTTVVILLVALCACAAATIGPTYYAAAKQSILQDDLRATTVFGRGFSAVQTGGVPGILPPLDSGLSTLLDQALGGAQETDRLFRPPVLALETTVFFTASGENVPLVWRTDVCRHLTFRSGRCPRAQNEVAVATSLAGPNHWKLGQRVHPAGRQPLDIVGIYDVPAATDDYWFARGTTYFPAEQPTERSLPYDALFTPRATIDGLGGHPQGAAVVSRTLDVGRVTTGDVDTLARLDPRITNTTSLGQTVITTALAATAADVHASWSSLAVPVAVVTAELLVLTWLLLFLVVTDAVEARGGEIALAKLRGYGAGRALLFGLGEPVSLLAVALPVGALLGWGLTRILAGVLLRPGTPVDLPGLGWGAAAIAAVGGIAAVVVAARRTLTRPVVDQWRRTGRRAADRGWLFDAIVLTGTVAGLVQLGVSGTLQSGSTSALALLVPGLLGLAIAVVGSRLLPMLARARFGRTRRSGGLGGFLAVRHIARRPGGTRTTMILATAVALATFSISSWSIGNANRTRIAQAQVGAPTVLTVAPPANADLAALVDRIDPTGRRAVAVERFDNGTTSLLAVQPDRFASVAHWPAVFVDDPHTLLSGLHPAAPEPIVLDGDRVRLRLEATDLRATSTQGPPQVVTNNVTLDVVATGATAPTPIGLGHLTRGTQQLTATAAVPCPCTVQDLQLSPAAGPAQLAGTLTLRGLDVHTPHGWRPVPGATEPVRWIDTQDQQVQVGADPRGGLRWSFFATRGTPPLLRTHDHPDPLPAVVAAPLATADPTLTTSGLNGASVNLRVQGSPRAVPGAPAGGYVVDLTYAGRAAAGNLAPSTAQVWVRGDTTAVRHALAAAHVPVLSVDSSAEVDAQLRRQGPGLASVLFLADAAAAAVLAALAAVLSLSAAARRRRYEYAALAATGAPARTLYAALAIEQLVVIGFGALTGIAAGLIAVAIAGRSVPQFVTAPVTSLLTYRPSVWVLVGALGGGLLVLLGTAAIASAALLRSVTPDQLREAPS